MSETNLTEIGPVAWITSDRAFDDFLEIAGSCDLFVFDLETTGLDEHAVTGGTSNGGVAARVSMLSATVASRQQAGKPITYLVPLSHPKSPFLGTWRDKLTRLAQRLVQRKRHLVAHNAKFDLRWMYAMTGYDLSHLLHWDTQVGAYLLDENSSTRLKEVVPRIFNVPPWDEHDLGYPGASEDVDYWELGEYAALDTWFTYVLYDYQARVMFLNDDDPYADGPLAPDEEQDYRVGHVGKQVAMPTVASLTAVEQRGILLDLRWVEENLEEREETSKELLKEMGEKYGLDDRGSSAAATSQWFTRLTELAVERGDLKILSTTATGRPQWSKEVLGKLARQGYETAQLILDQRKATKEAEFLRSWLEKATPEGRIHANYNVGRVVSGRLSSSDPNMQQVTKSLRPAFIADPGHVIVDLDYSQLELRVAAFIARCEPMIEAFQRGDDLHSLLAARINGVPLDKVTPEMRQAAKAANFGLLYGQEAYGFRMYAEAVYGVELTEEEAVDIYNGFFDTWDGMRQWHEQTKRNVRTYGFVTSPIGRVRRLPEAQFDNAPYTTDSDRKAMNSPVQGFGADLMNISLASMQGYVSGIDAIEGVQPLATVHDSAVVQVPEDRWRELAEATAERMKNPHPVLRRMGVNFDVPLDVEYEVGTRWGLADVGASE